MEASPSQGGAENGRHSRVTTDLEPSAYQLLASLEQAGALTPTGLTLTDPNMPIEQAAAVGRLLGKMDSSVKFAIGDWLLFTEQVYPDEWSQLVEVLGLSEDRRREYMRVSQRVPKSRRRSHVDWSHHRAVAPLPPPEQKEWLKKVETEGLSHHALRDALRPANGVVVRHECPTCGRPYPGGE